jgi:hypothetical protein
MFEACKVATENPRGWARIGDLRLFFQLVLVGINHLLSLKDELQIAEMAVWYCKHCIFSLTEDRSDFISAGSLLDTADGAQQYTISNPYNLLQTSKSLC